MRQQPPLQKKPAREASSASKSEESSRAHPELLGAGGASDANAAGRFGHRLERIAVRAERSPPSRRGLAIRHSAASEAEADRLAHAALGPTHAPHAMKAPFRPGLEGAVDAATERAIQDARGGGQPLAAELREPLEATLGMSLDSVRVHTDERAHRVSRMLGARAFAVGQDLFFKQGEYNPGTAEGRHVVAHEVAHVAQQGFSPGLAPSVQLLLDLDNSWNYGVGWFSFESSAAKEIQALFRRLEDEVAALQTDWGEDPRVNELVRYVEGLNAEKKIPYSRREQLEKEINRHLKQAIALPERLQKEKRQREEKERKAQEREEREAGKRKEKEEREAENKKKEEEEARKQKEKLEKQKQELEKQEQLKKAQQEREAEEEAEKEREHQARTELGVLSARVEQLIKTASEIDKLGVAQKKKDLGLTKTVPASMADASLSQLESALRAYREMEAFAEQVAADKEKNLGLALDALQQKFAGVPLRQGVLKEAAQSFHISSLTEVLEQEYNTLNAAHPKQRERAEKLEKESATKSTPDWKLANGKATVAELVNGGQIRAGRILDVYRTSSDREGGYSIKVEIEGMTQHVLHAHMTADHQVAGGRDPVHIKKTSGISKELATLSYPVPKELYDALLPPRDMIAAAHAQSGL